MPDHNKYHNGRFTSNGQESASFQDDQQREIKEDEISIKQLFFTLWNSKWIIIGSVILFGFIAGIMAYTATPIYESNGSILISQPQNSFSGLNLGGGGALGDILSSSYGVGGGSSLDNELEILQSRKLSNAIADSLISALIMPNGRQYPVIFRAYPVDSTVTSQDTVAARLRGKLTFEMVKTNATVIDVLYESPSAYEAGQVIDVALSEYKNLSTTQNQTSASSAGTFLEKEKKNIEEKLRKSEEALQDFMNENKLVEVDAQTNKVIQQMADLESRRQQARVELVAANSGIERYQSELNAIKPGLAEQYSQAVGADISRLQYAKSELEVEKQQLLINNTRLNASSPEIKEIDRKIGKYKNRILELAQDLINENDRYLGFIGGEGVAESVSGINQKLIGLQVQKTQSQAQIDVINEQLTELRGFFNSLPDNITELARLKRDLKINEGMFLAVTQQLAQTSLWEQSQYGLGRVIDSGFIPKEPAKPIPLLYVLIGMILGGMISVGYIFTKELFSTTITGAESIMKLGAPLLALIPDLGKYSKKEYADRDYIDIQGTDISTRLVAFMAPESPVSETFRQLENKLIYSGDEKTGKSILVTSAAKGEGKTTTIANLGVVLAEAGFKTVVVDADFRQPGLHTMFGVEQTPGITDVITNKTSLTDAIQPTVVPGLSVMTGGARPDNAAAASRDKAFLALVRQLENQFDYVLVDSAPYGVVTDAAPLLKQVNDVVLVAKFGSTSSVEFTRTLKQLQSLNAGVKGTVLTSYDPAKSNDADPRHYEHYAVTE